MSDIKNSKKAKPLQGVVTSDKMTKSRVVTVERVVKHGRYGKFLKRQTKIMFHDEKNESQVGDLVQIMASRPYSASKRFNLYKILKHAGDTVDVVE